MIQLYLVFLVVFMYGLVETLWQLLTYP
jgi:hypothetical protein